MDTEFSPFLRVLVRDAVVPQCKAQRKWRGCSQLKKRLRRTVEGGSLIIPAGYYCMFTVHCEIEKH